MGIPRRWSRASEKGSSRCGDLTQEYGSHCACAGYSFEMCQVFPKSSFEIKDYLKFVFKIFTGYC